MQPCLTCMLSKKYTLQVRRFAMLYSGKAGNYFCVLIIRLNEQFFCTGKYNFLANLQRNEKKSLTAFFNLVTPKRADHKND